MKKKEKWRRRGKIEKKYRDELCKPWNPWTKPIEFLSNFYFIKYLLKKEQKKNEIDRNNGN